MNIREFLRLLDHVKGPNGSGEYIARCPCHDDKTASLSVGVKRQGGRDRIVFDCHAGCDGRDILAKLGITTAQLSDPEEERKPRRDQPAQKPAQNAQAKPAEKPAPEKKDEGPRYDFNAPTRVYHYRDAQGAEVFQVCRFETVYQGKRVKTFRQRRYLPGDPKANAAGYVWTVPDEIRDTTLYRLPELIQAVKAGETVYLVEGEKDVETLVRLGVAATCNPGGAGKWRSGYNAWFDGADVVILPDNDPANPDDKEKGHVGQRHAWYAASQLNGKAKRVRIVDLTQCCPELPSKGDVSDMVAKMGDQAAMDALARALAATPDFDPEAPEYWLTPMEQAEMLYGDVRGYGVKEGCLIQYQQNGWKPLTDFVPLMRMELISDDGITRSLSFVLDGWQRSGIPLPRVTVGAKELDTMSWVTGSWGTHASVSPGNTNGAKVAWAIKQVGQRSAKRVIRYMHTGWRQIGGTWCYLYQGGAVGMDGVTVDMGANALKNYCLGGSEDISFRDGAEMSLRISRILKPHIATALLGVTYLAPLREWMVQTDTGPAFCLFLHGITGTHKSTVAALSLAHYGNFHSKNPPASFNDTANQIRSKAFLVKDMPLLVDDYHPTSSVQEARQMAATAQAISRAFGDGSDRGRLNADRTLSDAKPPRSVAIITGEDLPAVGESGLARYYIVEIGREDAPITKELTELQEAAREGYLQRAMRGYITWLSKQTDRLPGELHDMYIKFRETVRQMSEGAHDRSPETVACLLIGYQMMLYYFRDVGVIGDGEAREMWSDAVRTLVEAARQQARELRSQKPSVIFLTALGELLSSHTANTMDLTGPVDKQREPENMIGYMDNKYYYLLPNVAYSMVSELARRQDARFPVTLKGLYKHLKEDGVCGDAVTDESITRNKRVGNRTLRLLWIPRTKIDGDKPAVQQSLTGFEEVDEDPDNPF